MTRYVALLRAVNVGGTGKLAMADLRNLCAEAGFERVETYIASGNVVFESAAPARRVKAALETRLQGFQGKPATVLLRTAAQIRAVLKANPFPSAAPKHTNVIFLDQPPPSDVLASVKGQTDEEIVVGEKEIFVHYPSGMGRSKLRLPAAEAGTARNMNTVVKLAEMAAAS